MKKLVLILSAALLLASCAKEEMTQGNNSESPATEQFAVISASIDQTKTTTNINLTTGESVTTWNEGDVIVVTYNEENYTYVASQSGPSTTFVAQGSGLPLVDKLTNVTARYASTSVAVQNIDATGATDCPAPLLASAEEVDLVDGAFDLTFAQNGSILELAFAAENITISSLELISDDLEGIGAEGITVNFASGLDLSQGDAKVQVVLAGGLNLANEDEGLILKATLSDDTVIARSIWFGTDKNYPLGSHIYQPLGVWFPATPGIKAGKDLRELAILVNNGLTPRKFLDANGKINVLADINISAYPAWDAVGNNGAADIASTINSAKILNNDIVGNNHTISGLDQSRKHSRTGIYYGVFGIVNANISDLTVQGEVTVASSGADARNLYCGGLASILMPGKTISGCENNVAIYNQSFPRRQKDSNDKMTQADSRKHSFQKIGGIVGECRGNVLGCVNNAKVQFSSGHSISDVYALVLLHYGGVIGHVCENGAENVLIQGCVNNGLVDAQKSVPAWAPAYSNSDPVHELQGLSVGGVIGTAGHMVTRQMDAQSGTVTVKNCSSSVIPLVRNVLGANVGGVIGRTGCDSNITVEDCYLQATTDDFTDVTTSSSSKTTWSGIQNNGGGYQHNGKLEQPYMRFGGVIGSVHQKSGKIKNCSNYRGNLGCSSDCYAALGGVIGFVDHECYAVEIDGLLSDEGVNVKYKRNMSGKTSNDCRGGYGGVIGKAYCSHATNKITLSNLTSHATVGCTGENSVISHNQDFGGLVGTIQGCSVEDSTFDGVIYSTNGSGKSGVIGGLVGRSNYITCALDNLNIDQNINYLKRCVFSGSILYDANQSKRRGIAFGYCWQLSCEDCQMEGTFGRIGDTSLQWTVDADNVSLYAVEDIINYTDEGGLYTNKISVGSYDGDFTSFSVWRTGCGNTPFTWSFTGGGGD